MKNTDKIALVEVKRTSSLINLDSKYIWAISNADNDVTRDLGLTGIKKQ